MKKHNINNENRKFDNVFYCKYIIAQTIDSIFYTINMSNYSYENFHDTKAIV